ncbi:MAG TPA: alpha-L-arabinofuranosidase C-terminal domain-containing protein [Terracidiphilus sp.]|jgi:alpha-N-arabinofuranosidase|nr:alpha-L-arabinofuranosidase C-terminal domain-containing protein [Terracidiphilus sp.]
MKSSRTRRQFLAAASATATLAALSKSVWASSNASQRFVIRADEERGRVSALLHGQFAEHLGSCIYGGLWVGEESKIPNINGYRKSAIEYLKALEVPVLRWPGGCFADDYHWREGIGPKKQRPKRVNISWGNYVEDNSFGTHEFITLCRLIGAEPYLAGNVGSGSPSELRDWLEYCNYPSGSKLSDERAANGSAEPFRVKFWGVGNENWGCGGSMRPDYYAGLYRQFATYLREMGGMEPFLIASGPSGDDVRWTRGLLDTTFPVMPDGMSMHYYSGGAKEPTHFDASSMDQQLGSFKAVEEAVIHQRAVLDGYREGARIGLILDEWGVWDQIPEADEKRYGKLWQQSTMRSGVAAGLGLNLFNRQASKLYMCNIAQIDNVLQSLLLTDGPEGERCVRTTTYYAFELFKGHRGKTSVNVESDSKDPLGISVSATLGEGKLVVSLVNPDDTKTVSTRCDLAGVKGTKATARILHSPDRNAANTFDAPDTIVPQDHPARLETGNLIVQLPPLSLVTVVVETA